MIIYRPCKWCLKDFEEHEYYTMDIRFCLGQVEDAAETLDYYIPCTNLEYLEYRYEKTQAIR